MNWLRTILTRAGEWLRALKRQLDVMADTRIILILVALIGTVLVWMPQGRDVVVGLIDEANSKMDEGGFSGPFSLAAGHWAALLAACVWSGLNIWYWSHLLCRTDPDTPHPRWFNWLRRLLGISPLLFALAAMQRGSEWRDIWLGFSAFAIVAALMLLFFVRRPARLVAVNRPKGVPRVGKAEQQELGLIDRLFIGASLAVAAFMFVSFMIPGWRTTFAWLLGPGAVAFGALACIVPLTSLLIWWTRRYRFPVVSVGIVLFILFSEFNDNHDVRTLADGPVRARIDIDEALERWRKLHGPDDPIVLVAAAGGASRAAYWTGTVLRAIEERDTDLGFSHDVFAISSVSGGTLGAVGYSAWVAERQDPQGRQPPDRGERLRFVRSFFGSDYLGPAMGGLLFPDLLQRFLPAPVMPSRADSLEEAWEMGWAAAAAECRRNLHTQPPSACPDGDRMSSDYLSIWNGVLDEGAVTPRSWVPIVLANGTHVQTGKRIITAPVTIRPLVFPDSYDFFDSLRRPIRASTAIHNSARFPIVSPAGTIRRGPEAATPGAAGSGNSAAAEPDAGVSAHIVDGGYFENGGIETLLDLARHIRERWPTRRILIVEIINDDALSEADSARCRADPGSDDCRFEPLVMPRHDASPLLGEVSAIGRAMFATREARSVLGAKRASLPGGGKFEYYQFRLAPDEQGRRTAMSWSLSRSSRDRMDAMFARSVAEVNEIISERIYTGNRKKEVRDALIANFRSRQAVSHRCEIERLTQAIRRRPPTTPPAPGPVAAVPRPLPLAEPCPRNGAPPPAPGSARH